MSWFLWQLVDSAFPAGGFAHSGGLESAWQHGEIAGAAALERFVEAALLQTAYGIVPLVNAAHRDPGRLEELDALDDVFLTNIVANRASRVQGRAWLATSASVWPSPELSRLAPRAAATASHAAPIVGATLRVLGIDAGDARRVVLFSAARSVLAASVRLGIVGSYEAQRLQHAAARPLDAALDLSADFDERDLAQAAPINDVLLAGHGRLYSRLFQS